MLLDWWWLFIVGVVLLAFVIFQAWDRRRGAERYNRQETHRVDRQAALYAKDTEHSNDRRSLPKS
jgi:hypothetical protein